MNEQKGIKKSTKIIKSKKKKNPRNTETHIEAHRDTHRGTQGHT